VVGDPSVTVDRAELVRRYRWLVLQQLPELARRHAWVVTADHCFGRIVLDHTVGGRWYDVLDRRRSPAFTQLDDGQLARAIALAEQILAEGDPLLRRLDEQSLRWRGKPAKSGQGSTSHRPNGVHERAISPRSGGDADAG
jgi:hypothetical protein